MNQLNFGKALDAIKAGKRIARTGWNGKGMFVYLVPPASYPVQTGAAKAHFGAGAMVPYNAYMAIKNVDGTVSTWVPSVNDCLASDWGVVGESEQAASTVPPHQQRVLDEKQDLDLRIDSPVESQRERLRRECELILVHGAASVIANRPDQAREVADGIKAFLDGLEVGAEDQAQAGDSLACKGINCGCTDGQSHSNECIVEAAMIQGWAGDKEARDAFAAIKSKTFASRAATESVATQPAASPTPVDDAIEAEIQAKGLTAPRVTPADIEDEIASVHYFTAADGARMSPDGNWPIHNLNTGGLGLLTFCVLVLRNGFTVHGVSACVSPENFDWEIGKRIARENAVAKLTSSPG